MAEDQEAPSAGAADTADSGSPSPSETPANLSPDAIVDQAAAEYDETLGTAPADDAEEPTTAEGPEEPEAEAQAADEEEPQEEPDTQEVEQQVLTEDLKAAFKALKAINPKAEAVLRKEHYQLAQYREVVPLEEAREMRSLFPTVVTAREAHSHAANFLSLDSDLRSNPRQFIDRLAGYDPEAFDQIVRQWPQWLHQNDPEGYATNFVKPLLLGAMKHHAENAEDEDVRLAAQIMFEHESKVKIGPSRRDRDPRDEEIANYRRREKEGRFQEIASFARQTNGVYQEKLGELIQKAIERSGRSALTPEGRKEVVKRVVGNLTDRLMKDRLAQEKLKSEAFGGPRDAQHQQALVESMLGHVRPYLGPAVQEAVGWLTDTLTATNKTRHDKEKQIASRKPIASGAAPGVRTSKIEWDKLTPDQKAKYKPEQLVDMAARGDLV